MEHLLKHRKDDEYWTRKYNPKRKNLRRDSIAKISIIHLQTKRFCKQLTERKKKKAGFIKTFKSKFSNENIRDYSHQKCVRNIPSRDLAYIIDTRKRKAKKKLFFNNRAKSVKLTSIV